MAEGIVKEETGGWNGTLALNRLSSSLEVVSALAMMGMTLTRWASSFMVRTSMALSPWPVGLMK